MTKKSKQISLYSPLSGETKKLVEELYTAQRVIMPNEPCTPGQDPTYFVVAKLVSHLDKKAWEELCALTRLAHIDDAFALAEPEEQREQEEQNSAPGPFEENAIFTEETVASKTAFPSPQWMRHLLLSASFLRQLKQEISRARRGDAPLALVRFAMVNALNLEKATRILYAALDKHGEDCDTLGILDTKNFALILPGARCFKAQSIVEDILDECQHNTLALSAGIAVHTGNECNVQKFLEHAATALEQALTQKAALSMYKKPHESLEAKRTLVLGHEKRFLFGSIDEV